MSLRNRIDKLERGLAPRNEPDLVPFLTRDEMAVLIIQQTKQALKDAMSCKGIRPSFADKALLSFEPFSAGIKWAQDRAREVEAAGHLPDVLARLRAKGYDCSPIESAN